MYEDTPQRSAWCPTCGEEGRWLPSGGCREQFHHATDAWNGACNPRLASSVRVRSRPELHKSAAPTIRGGALYMRTSTSSQHNHRGNRRTWHTRDLPRDPSRHTGQPEAPQNAYLPPPSRARAAPHQQHRRPLPRHRQMATMRSSTSGSGRPHTTANPEQGQPSILDSVAPRKPTRTAPSGRDDTTTPRSQRQSGIRLRATAASPSPPTWNPGVTTGTRKAHPPLLLRGSPWTDPLRVVGPLPYARTWALPSRVCAGKVLVVLRRRP